MSMKKAALLACCLGLVALIAQEPASHTVTKADVDGWMKELSNWRRWGPTDAMGTVNLITPAKRKAAAALVKEGVAVSLAHDADTEKSVDNNSPYGHKMLSTGGRGQFITDEYSVNYHGLAHTHMDALSHFIFDGKMFDGYPIADNVSDQGVKRNDVTAFKNGIFTRGILMDIPRLKNLPYLEPSDPIYPEDLEAWEKKAGVKVGAGDVVFIYTGRWARRKALGAWNPSKVAGLFASCAKWLHQRDVAMVGSDSDTDVMPSGVTGVSQPLHQLLLNAMGTPIFDNCDLEAVADAAAKRNRWAFLITAAPISMPGGTGSPLNPTAVF
jgi:kynurenine formamidase